MHLEHGFLAPSIARDSGFDLGISVGYPLSNGYLIDPNAFLSYQPMLPDDGGVTSNCNVTLVKERTEPVDIELGARRLEEMLQQRIFDVFGVNL